MRYSVKFATNVERSSNNSRQIFITRFRSARRTLCSTASVTKFRPLVSKIICSIFIACANVFDGKGEFHHNAAIKGHNGEGERGPFQSLGCTESRQQTMWQSTKTLGKIRRSFIYDQQVHIMMKRDQWARL